MEFLDDIIAKRLASLEIELGTMGLFADQNEFDAEIARLVDVMTATAVLKGIDKNDAKEYFQENFVTKANEVYEQHVKLEPEVIETPENYAFADKQAEIEGLIEAGNLKEADKKIKEALEILKNDDIIKDSIDNGVFTQEDIDYFKDVACPHFQTLKLGKKKKASWKLFSSKGKNPYDNQIVKIKKEKVSLKEKFKKIKKWSKKRKIALTAAGLAFIAGLGIFAYSKLHNQNESAEYEPTDSLIFEDLKKSMEKLQSEEISIEKFQSEGIRDRKTSVEKLESIKFGVDEFHNFNINNQVTHTENLQLLAQLSMERGVPVVSEEECMKLSNESKLAVSPEQLNNWLISMNLEDMNDLTFTKLLANSNTDKEELTSDFSRVCNLLGAIYTTKVENPFIYQFISNKEYSEYIKQYEKAIIENQNGNSESLINLIKSRANNPVSATSSGPLGVLSTALIYQQANVYNAQVIGQDLINLYDVNNTCNTDTATFYSDDWAEYMRKVNSKFDAAIKYTGSEVTAYQKYLSTLSDEQNDNKVHIESQVLPYLKENNIQLGEWNVLANIANNNLEVKPQGIVGGNTTITTPATVKEIPKEPTTEEEKAVQAQVEKELEEENRQNFEDAMKGLPTDENGDFVFELPDQEPIIIDSETMGAYDPKKDYKGKTFANYQKFMDEYHEQIEYVEGVGNVVVTKDEELSINNPNVSIDKNGNLVSITSDGKTHKVETGTKKEMNELLNNQPSFSEWTITSEGKIHYSEVDDYLPEENSKVQTVVQQPVNQPMIKREPQGNNFAFADVDQNVLDTLTPEEQAALEEMLNAGHEPVAGEIVEESFEAVEPQSDISLQIAALEEAKAELTGDGLQAEEAQNVL